MRGKVPFDISLSRSQSCDKKFTSVTAAETSYLCRRQKHEKGFTVCCVAWHPSGTQIAYTDTEGRLGLLDGFGAPGADAIKVQL